MSDQLTIAGLAVELGTTRKIIHHILDTEKIEPTEIHARCHTLSRTQQKQVARALIRNQADTMELIERCKAFVK